MRELMTRCFVFFFFNDTATTEIYTLSLHDALPISLLAIPNDLDGELGEAKPVKSIPAHFAAARAATVEDVSRRSEEHTSELQSRQYLVCRLLLEKKKIKNTTPNLA